MRRVFLFLLVLMCSFVAGAQEFSVKDVNGNKLYFVLCDSGAVCSQHLSANMLSMAAMMGFNTKYQQVVIPEKVTQKGKEYPVVAIGRSAFSTCVNLVDVTIPNSVRIIDDYAFSSCI